MTKLDIRDLSWVVICLLIFILATKTKAMGVPIFRAEQYLTLIILSYRFIDGFIFALLSYTQKVSLMDRIRDGVNEIIERFEIIRFLGIRNS